MNLVLLDPIKRSILFGMRLNFVLDERYHRSRDIALINGLIVDSLFDLQYLYSSTYLCLLC